MPALTDANQQSILSILQSNLNGDTSILVPSGEAFYINSGTLVDTLALKYDGFVTKRGTLSEASPANGAILVLESAAQAAQFRAGDVCHLVGNAYAGAIDANNNAADQVTVSSVSGQRVVVTGRAGGIYSVGASLVLVDAGQPGGYAGGTSDGPAINNQVLGDFLASLETLCTPPTLTLTGVGTTTRLDIPTGGGGFAEESSLEGATVTMTTAAAAALQGCTAVVQSANVNAGQTELTLSHLKDNTGADVLAWPSAPQINDTATLVLNLTDGKLTDLREAGGDMTTAISSLLTMHRKLDETFSTPEIPLVNEWQVMGQKSGPILRLKMPDVAQTANRAYDNGSSTSITVHMDDAVGDLPIPLSGRLRVVNAQDGANSTGYQGSGSLPVSGAYVAYTRQKRSNILDLGAAGVLGANIEGNNVGRIVQIAGSSSGGNVINSGFAPQPDNKHLAMLLFQLVDSVNDYVVVGSA
jgi:hypothetical protein